MTLWKFQRLGLISLETPRLKWASSPGGQNLQDFLELRQVLSTYDGEPQGPALVASGKARPHASCSGASRDSSPDDAGA